MKAFKALPANVFIVLTLTVFLTLLSLPACAEEEIQAPEAVEDVAAEPAVVPVPDEAAGENVAEADKKVEEGVEASPEAAAGSAAMSMMDSGGGAGAGGSVSSAMIPEPSIFTGSLTTRIPIIVLPGRGGIAPNLALVYNSAKKNGWIGVGWDLDMGAIQRSTKMETSLRGLPFRR